MGSSPSSTSRIVEARKGYSRHRMSDMAVTDSSHAPLFSSLNLASIVSGDSPQRLQLSKEQVIFCTKALNFFKKKIRSPDTILKEFNQLQEMGFGNQERRYTVALRDENVNKNRYMNVLPFDNTRVPLNASYRPSMVRDGKPTSGYINASFIKVCC
ncbi:hypothetical protein ZOSMA_265G00130 [Zostera marina]|uniref:Tyrosine-protein phosphatase domain-containing protein n=1 Tax=Zostera marina TaxID=29655 RepID=A0A0K9PEV4_ZOSMR|nr:hypothetical protein ZOSMA_265G00130 [Zostera marina]